jgi:hypothetical protein
MIVKNDFKIITWSVVRRYSDFDALHMSLKQLFPFVQEFELPGKTLWNRAKMDFTLRAKSLEKYLQRLVDNTGNFCLFQKHASRFWFATFCLVIIILLFQGGTNYSSSMIEREKEWLV